MGNSVFIPTGDLRGVINALMRLTHAALRKFGCFVVQSVLTDFIRRGFTPGWLSGGPLQW